MKNILSIFCLLLLAGCGGNQTADSKPSDLDHTINKDTLNHGVDTTLSKDSSRVDSINKKIPL